MNLNDLLDHWREGTLSEAEMRELIAQLSTTQARASLRGDWFLEAALPEALRAARVPPHVVAPQARPVARWTPRVMLRWAAAAAVVASGALWLLRVDDRETPPIAWQHQQAPAVTTGIPELPEMESPSDYLLVVSYSLHP